MSWVNNGKARSIKIIVYKYDGIMPVLGYPKTYNGQNTWGNPSYPTLTDNEVQKLSDSEYSARLAAFKLYVESVELGLDIDSSIVGDGFEKTDLVSCPLP